MEIKWHNRILVRVSAILLILTALSVTVFYWYGYSSSRSFLRDEMDRFTRTTSARLAGYLGEPMARADREKIEAIVEAELRDDRIAWISVKNIDQSVLLAWEKSPRGIIVEASGSGRKGFPGGAERIIYDNKVLGSIELSVQPDFMASALSHSVTNLSLLTAGLNLLIFLTLYVVLRKILTLPMMELTKAAENISLGYLEGAIVNRSKDELGQLTAAIERLRVSMRIAIKRLASSKKGLAGIGAEELKDVILGKKNYGFEFLALRILVGRLTLNYRNNPTPETMRKCVQQLLEFFQNERNPLAQKDLSKISAGAAL